MVFGAKEGGRVNGGTFKEGFVQFTFGCHAENFRQRPRRGIALKALNSAGGEDKHTVARFAAHILLPAIGQNIDFRPVNFLRVNRRGCVANGQAFAVSGNEICIGHAHARCGAIPCKDDITVTCILV